MLILNMIKKVLLLFLITSLLYLSYLGSSKHQPMKFTASISINQPLAKTVALWQDKNNFKHWQDGFISKELISGTKGEVGVIYLIKLDFNKDIMELTETVQLTNLPHEHKVLIAHKHMHNTMHSKFTAIDDSTTLWTAEIDYFQVNFWPAKVMMRLFPNMFKKQGQKWSNQFKEFAEQQ
jgi:hypothetical protein